MIKNKGNIQKALFSLEQDQNNAVSFIYKNAKFGKGILENATITLKDLFATKDAPTQASSKILENFTPYYDADIVTLLKNQGAAILAKVHMDELALGGTGTFSAFGLVKNVLDDKRLSGGSSSGSVSTFNKNITIAIASDTGDSVRLPASYNGVVGFKPSYGAVSRYGMFAYASSLDTVAWFAHNVNDAIVLAQVLFGKSKNDLTSKDVEKPILEIEKPKKVAFLKLESVLPSKVLTKYNQLQEKLRKENIEVKEIEIDQQLLDLIEIVYSIISFSEVSSNDSNLTSITFGKQEKGSSWEEIAKNSRTKNLGQMVQRRFILGSYFLLAENQEKIFKKAQKMRRIFKNVVKKIYQENDCFVFVSASEAPLRSKDKDKNWFSNFLSIANFVGNPSISIPFTENENLPIGLSIETNLYEDKKLLSYSLFFEKLLGEQNE